MILQEISKTNFILDCLFPTFRKRLMCGLEWGIYHNKYGTATHDPKAYEKRIVELLDDEDVSNQKGIYEYLLDGNEHSCIQP